MCMMIIINSIPRHGRAGIVSRANSSAHVHCNTRVYCAGIIDIAWHIFPPPRHPRRARTVDKFTYSSLSACVGRAISVNTV